MQLFLRNLALLGAAALMLWSMTHCSPPPAPHVDRCLEGTTPTPDGCRAVPDWNPWATDAGPTPPRDGGVEPEPVRDGGVRDGGVVVEPPRDGGTPDAPLEGLSGTWALEVVNAQIVNNEYVGQRTVVSTSVAIVDMVQDGEEVELSTRLCSVVSEPYGETTTSFDVGYIGGVPIITTVAMLDASTATFEPSERRMLVGWAADADPVLEEVPTTDEDPRVFDVDGDGEPGVTIHVSGSLNGDLHVAQRTTVELFGAIESDERITGTSRTTIEREILGSTNPLLRAGDTTQRPHPDLERSPFEMIRMPFGASCEEVATALAAP